MKKTTNFIQKQYEGFLKTPNFWKNAVIESLHQFELANTSHSIQLEKVELRLGKRVEQFVLFQLEQEQIPILASNLQIQNGKKTIGEIDFIIEQNGNPVHLEVCYKYYLFDPKIEGDEIDKSIGPNRRDSFILKLRKLKEKQFPLLQNEVTQQHLTELGITTDEISQQVIFKAQLYLPANSEFNNTLAIEESNIQGYYYRLHELIEYSNCKFYIPMKPDWLMEPLTQIDWLNYDNFNKEVSEFLNNKNAPLVWLKKPTGALEKIFVVWW